MVSLPRLAARNAASTALGYPPTGNIAFPGRRLLLLRACMMMTVFIVICETGLYT
jgi:hypothetical protein